MKKISHHQRIWLTLRAIREIDKRTRINKRKHRPPKRQRPGQSRTIHAPNKFYFLAANARDELFEFIKDVKTTLMSGIRVVIDFANTVELHPCGTLIFMAHLDTWLAAFPYRLSCTYPKNDVVEQLLQNVSVLSRLGLTNRKQVDHDAVRFWHYHCGVNADSAQYKELTKSVRTGIVHPNKELFADCLNEAVVNAVNHAYEYPGRRLPPKDQQKWWIFSLLRDDHLFVAIYDLGVGIAASLRRKPEWREFLKIRHYKDARLIEAAVDSALTRTRLLHRGQGLPEMLDFSKNLKAGGLSIWSQKGGIEYNADRGEQLRHKVSRPLEGTLVLWSIPFRKEQANAIENDLHS